MMNCQKHQPSEHQPSANPGCRLAALTMALLLACVGCGRSKPAAVPTQNTGPAAAEVSQVQQTFATADAGLRYPLAEALKVVQAGGYADALPNLRRLAANPTLKPAQKQALQSLIQKLEGLPAQAGPS